MQGDPSSSTIDQIRRFEITVFYLVLVGGTGMICWESRAYFLPEMIHGFVLSRIELAVEDWWRYTLVTHVAGGLICLFSSLTQYSGILLKRATWLHRALGRIYALSIIILVFPTGAALAFVAKGGLSGTIGFLLLSFGTLGTLLLGMVAIYKKNLSAHRIWISRSFALVTSAITFRILQLGISKFDLNEETIYLLSLWISMTLNVILCEFYLLRTQKK